MAPSAKHAADPAANVTAIASARDLRRTDAFRTLSEQLSDPCALIQYAPGVCALEASEIFSGPDGPDPVQTAKSACRNLDLAPALLLVDPDPETPAACYLLTHQEVRVARVCGLGVEAIERALFTLHMGARDEAGDLRCWSPGRGREYPGDDNGDAVASRIPGPRPVAPAPAQGLLL